MRRALDFEVECQRKKSGPMRTMMTHGKSRLRKKCDGWLENGRCTGQSKWSAGINQIAAGLR